MLGIALLAEGAAAAADISGAGATFPYPIYAKWAEIYKTRTGVSVVYQSIGSGGGISQIRSKTVDFGASDMPLESEKLDESGFVQFPMVIGGVVPVVNLAGVKPGELKLDARALADIYLGRARKWNDPAITRLNPGLKLTSQPIVVLARSDSSGTTFIFTNYLSKVSADWRDRVGTNASVDWPVGTGAKGNEGIAALASRTPGAIGYVEYAYARQNQLTYALVQNRDGAFVRPEIKSFQSAAANADWRNAPGFYLLLTDQPGKESWPITGASFILMYKTQEKPAVGRQTLDFFSWSYRSASAKLATELDYVPIPSPVVELVQDMWRRQIRDTAGKPIWAGPAGEATAD